MIGTLKGTLMRQWAELRAAVVHDWSMLRPIVELALFGVRATAHNCI